MTVDVARWGRRALAACELCEHRCGVDRFRELGVCLLPASARAYRVFLHHGEEPEISPTLAVFVTGCSFRCAYCSDAAFVARPDQGEAIEPAALAARIDDGWRAGARSVSFVGGNPDENLPALLEVVDALEEPIPVVWNSNLFLTPEPLALLAPRVAVFVPDFKFGNDACARAIARADRYGEVLRRNLSYVHGKSRLIVRHLVMPGHVECCTRPVAEFIARELPAATLNVLTQFEPLFATWTLPRGLALRPVAAELAHALHVAAEAGVTSLWSDGSSLEVIGG